MNKILIILCGFLVGVSANAALDLSSDVGTMFSIQDYLETDIEKLDVPIQNFTVTPNGEYRYMVKNVDDFSVSLEMVEGAIPKELYNACREAGESISSCHDIVEENMQKSVDFKRLEVRDRLKAVQETFIPEIDYFATEFDPMSIHIQ